MGWRVGWLGRVGCAFSGGAALLVGLVSISLTPIGASASSISALQGGTVERQRASSIERLPLLGSVRTVEPRFDDVFVQVVELTLTLGLEASRSPGLAVAPAIEVPLYDGMGALGTLAFSALGDAIGR